MKHYNLKSNENKTLIGNWCEDRTLAQLPSLDKSDKSFISGTSEYRNNFGPQTIVNGDRSRLKLHQYLTQLYQSKVKAELEAERFRQEAETREELKKHRQVKKVKVVKRLVKWEPPSKYFHRKTAFTNDPTAVPEKIFLEEALGIDVDYEFFTLIKAMADKEVGNKDYDDFRTSIERKYGINIQTTLERAQLHLKENCVEVEGQSLEQLFAEFTRSSSFSQPEAFLAAHCLAQSR